MKFYSEKETRDLKLAIEERVLKWPEVTTKKMFGCPCYQVNGRLFMFLVTEGIVITRLVEADINELFQKYNATFFQAGQRIVKKWIKLSIESKDLEMIMPYVRKSYEAVLQNK